MKQRGRPVLGAIAGLFFGIFIRLDLFVFGVLPLESNVLAFIPLVGLIAGVALGLTSPLGRRKAVHITKLPNFDPNPNPAQGGPIRRLTEPG